jgi:hypothetical protein
MLIPATTSRRLRRLPGRHHPIGAGGCQETTHAGADAPSNYGCSPSWGRPDPTLLPFPTAAYDPDADRFELTAEGVAYLTEAAEPPLA